ncbi:GBF-interacting protein 1-like isoform X2 [Olea europaea var. sylvestris]|uniref:GBF-interacting protein 1-like isoform X2 n=1 Tax=Olea europaea var. sylvestris TaxID=158386 RepID=UPI000C1D771F|nr:GBF-interacting protein 1-like isoform X2 [Olea europaea var. sylvestris]
MSGASRVSIPNNLKKTIQDIKEIAGEHSDEDIYAMLKECSMDPNETAQKLLYLDTFHEVKSKRDRRKVTVNSRAYDDHRRTPGMQRRGTRGGSENYYSSSISDVVGGGKQVNAGQENGYNRRTERASKSYVPGPHKTENNESCFVMNSSTSSANNSASVFNGSLSEKSTSQLSLCNIGGTIKDTSTSENSKLGKMPFLQSVAVKQIPNLYPGPTPSPTPTRASTAVTGTMFEGGKSKLISSHLGNSMGSTSVSGLYSSASDPLLVPSINPQYSGGIGITKPETGKQQIAAQVSTNPPADNRIRDGQIVTKALAVSGSVDSTSNKQPRLSGGVDRSQLAEPPLMASSTNHNVTPACRTNQKTPPLQDDSASKQAISEVDTKLPKLHISARQSVIFPNHIHVPEAFLNGLTFGSLNVPMGQSNMESKLVDVSFATNVEAVKEFSVIDQPASSTAGQDDYPDCPPSHPHISDNFLPSQENVSTGAALRYDQAKQELLQSVGGSQNPFISTVTDYSLSLVHPVIGSRLVQAEGLELQGGKSQVPSTTGSDPLMTQPAGIGKNSIPVSPQMFPYLRHPYPPNCIPYNPYFSQLYMTPPNAHQFLGNSGFPQQPSTGNIYMPPTATAAGVKFPVPSLCKPGTVVGNLTHYGIPSGYGSYGASGVSYSPSAALAPGNSANNNDILGSELKEKTIYSTIKQNDDFHAWTSAPGRDVSTLQANVFYNLPLGQGQHSIFPSQVGHGTFPGIYQPTQNLSTLKSLPQQSQAVAGPLGAYLATTIATSAATATCTDELEKPKLVN